MKDESPRVRFFAALALGHHGQADAAAPLLRLLRDNNNDDAFVRHAASIGLAGIGDIAALAKAATDSSAAVRLGAVLALRRLQNPEAAKFLADADPKVATEAGLAIYEAPIDAALPALASLTGKKGLTEPLMRRAINAANRVGRGEDAVALAQFAATDGASKNGRVEALSILSVWAKPPGRDRINGLWRPVDGRAPEVAADAVRPVVGSILKDAPDDVRIALLKAVAELKVRDAGADIVAMIASNTGNVASRVEAIRTLEKLDDPRLGEAVGLAIGAKEGGVRAEGLRVLARLDPEKAIPALGRVLEIGSTGEKQKALDTLGATAKPEADAGAGRGSRCKQTGKAQPRDRARTAQRHDQAAVAGDPREGRKAPRHAAAFRTDRRLPGLARRGRHRSRAEDLPRQRRCLLHPLPQGRK